MNEPSNIKGYLGNPLLKKANQSIDWTEELVAEYIKCSNDPIYFIQTYMKIINVNDGLVNFNLYDYQKDMINSMNDNRYTIINTSRQIGKSITTCAYILWYIIFNSEKTVALLANKGDTAREILGRVQLAYQHLPKWLQQGVKEWNKGSLWLENDSRVIAAATSTSAIRGYSINCLFLDECAFIDNWDEFFTSVFPTISSGDDTKIVLCSCVSKDTYVFTDHGIQQVKDFVDSSKPSNPILGYYVPQYKVHGHDKLNTGHIMVNSGKTKTRIIKTKSSELECSLNHKLWACKNGVFGWFKAEELTSEDYISIKYNMNIWGDDDDISSFTSIHESTKNGINLPNVITKDLAYFMGLFLAEGYMDEYRTTITCGDDISYTFNKLNFKFGTYDSLHYNICSKKLVSFLKEIGFDPTLKAKNKVIPKRLLRCSREIMISFLRGMFDGDGCATKRGKISYTSASEELINQVRMLLLNLGITSQKYKNIIPSNKKVKTESTIYVLEINSFDDCNLFYDTVGFALERKQKRKETLKTPTRNITKDIIPFGRDVFTNISKNGVHKNNKHVSRKYCLDNGHIKEGICEHNIKWEKIKTIKESENDVYDFSLDHTDDFWCHSVVYNGILGHQTPNGMNHFHSIWSNAIQKRNQYNPILVTWDKVPGRDEKWKQDTLASMNFDIEKFNQEYCAEFLGSSGTLISGSKLKELVHQIPISQKDGLIQYKLPEQEHVYIMVCDVSRGKGLDYSAFQVIDVTKMPYNQVCVYRNNSIAPVDYASIIHGVAKGYNNASVLVEINDIGEQVSHSLHYDMGYDNILFTENAGRSGKRITAGFGGSNVDKGIRTTRIVKSVGCSILKLLIEQNQLLIHDYHTINELSTFSKKGKSYEAEPTKHDDLVIGLVLFAWLSDQEYFKEYTDINTLKNLREKTEDDIEQDLAPFGFVVSGNEDYYDESYEEINPDAWMFNENLKIDF